MSIAVHFHAGSHYMTLQMLEGFLSRNEIKLVHIPVSGHRYTALLKRTVDAITVPEPWISLAEKQKHKVICEAFCVGSEVASPEIKPEIYAAINRAIKKAVRLINGNKKKYLHYFTSSIPQSIGKLGPADFHLPRLRYVDPVPYPPAEFERACRWMWSWNLIYPEATFDRVVDNRIAVAS